MNIPPYWVNEKQEIAGMQFRLHGSSHKSMTEALERKAVREKLFRLYYVEKNVSLDVYRKLLTEILEQEKTHSYEVEIYETELERITAQSVITRNRYGAEVLNTTELCFMDVDAFPASGWERFKSLFGSKMPTDEERLIEELHRVHREQADLSARLYRTAAGWRIIFYAEGLTLSSQRLHLLECRLNADPLYAALCYRQQCWRARLTPKPSRLGVKLGHFPRRSASDVPAEGEAEWIAAYREACRGKAVCRWLKSFGSEIRHPLVRRHDECTVALQRGAALA